MILGSTLEQPCIYYNDITLSYFAWWMSLSCLKLKSSFALQATAYRAGHVSECGIQDLPVLSTYFILQQLQTPEGPEKHHVDFLLCFCTSNSLLCEHPSLAQLWSNYSFRTQSNEASPDSLGHEKSCSSLLPQYFYFCTFYCNMLNHLFPVL